MAETFCFDSNEKYYKTFYNIKVGDQPYEKLDGYVLWNKIYPNYTPKDILKAYKTLCNRKH